MYKLSFLVPSLNEEFLPQTVDDILAHTSDQSEVIVVLDGWFTELKPHPRLRIMHNETPKGQRAATNQACKLSEAKYVCKIDAHCSLKQDWDIEMFKAFEQAGDDVTMVSIMRNLWAFNWVCPKDNTTHYQDKGNICPTCKGEMVKDIVWIAKERPESYSYRFDTTLHFQYFREYKKHPQFIKDKPSGLTETMSLQGSLFMLTREKYWELNICDEEWGSWGQQGVEVACKTWLSGGKCLVNHNTWYAHMFRTKHGVFGFPYKQDEKQIEHARELSRKLFLDNTWPLQKYPLVWLVDRFSPVPDWEGSEMLEKIREHGKEMVK